MTIVELLARWAVERPDEPAYTFIDYSNDLAGTRETLSWSEVDARARSVAAALRRIAEPGDRVAILAPQGLHYVVGLLGVCYAGVIAVPLFVPGLPGHRSRLEHSLMDSAPVCALTTSAVRDQAESLLAVPMVSIDDVTPTAWRPEPIGVHDIAYLQYTSGSTGRPTGVIITHDNALTNAEQCLAVFGCRRGETVTVSWLPLFHDMGLMLAVLVPIVRGDQAIFIDPIAFLMRPARWLELASTTTKEVFTAAPNFAYDYCAKRVSEADKAGLDLSRIRLFLNGAEPIRPATIDRFAEAFRDCGLDPRAHTPAYGLAEAVVLVSTSPVDLAPQVRAFDADALGRGVAHEPEGRSVELATCGRPFGQRVVIVDPASGSPRAAGEVGEIWVWGPNVARGYWGDPQRTAETFGAILSDGSGPWLRTGDLGVLCEENLYLTGRLKDLVIVDGRNHYPQDIEATVHAAHPIVRPGKVAAFAVPAQDTERLVVVIESTVDTDPDDITRAVRAAVRREHGLRVHDVVVAGRGAVHRTSSGKLARHATREWFLSSRGNAVEPGVTG